MGMRTIRPPAGTLERKVRNAARAALGAAVTLWHSVMLPQHFTTGGAAKYDYAPRTAKYMRRKARVMKHQRPLVGANRQTSGDSERAAKTDFTIRTTQMGTHLAGVVTMNMPTYFFQHPSGGDTFIDKPAELTRTTPDEETRLQRVIDERFASEMDLNLRIA